jgi:formate hydrogenlyase subunit 3/multisubunit Na+/H+ antiporter MnhD subunit
MAVEPADGIAAPGGIFAAFAASQFAVILTNLGIDERTRYADWALAAAALTLPFLIATWTILREAAANRTRINNILTGVGFAAVFAGFAAIVLSIAHVSETIASGFAVCGAAALLYAYGYESRYSEIRTWEADPAAQSSPSADSRGGAGRRDDDD